MSNLADNRPYPDLVAELIAEGFGVKLDITTAHAYRVRVSLKAGGKVVYNEHTTSTAGYATSVLRAWSKVQEARMLQRIPERTAVQP